MRYLLTPSNYDGVVSALTGNGEICTTLGPAGYHTPVEQAVDVADRTQHFVWAGRRRQGPQHPLINFGTITRTLRVDGETSVVETWEQEIDWGQGSVLSTWKYAWGEEKTRAFIALQDNLFLVDTVLALGGETETIGHDFQFTVTYRFGETDAALQVVQEDTGFRIAYRLEEHLGDLFFGLLVDIGDASKTDGPKVVYSPLPNGAQATVSLRLEPGQAIVITSWLHFSDRLHYEFPVLAEGLEAVAERHEEGWIEFWGRSEVITGDETVDDFRQSTLYTLRCQATPWSIPPTLSEKYWGGGAFHDEMYPFFGLLSSNYPDFAARLPYFRLTTLPRAIERARARGALYPWSSTEYGEERDPNGLWLTERFHLGQFAVCIHALWLYEQDPIQREDLYPVLYEMARYFELNMLERDPQGRLRTRACVDFDESVGAVTNGPFTISAAIASLEYAADAAKALERDGERARIWSKLAAELRQNLPRNADDLYAIPDDKPLHYALLGPIFPFRIDIESSGARRSVEHIHRLCRSGKGWKPGFSDVFTNSNWMWTAGHLGIVHALQENAELAWAAVWRGPESAGAFLSPNEHLKDDIVQVPWFTTGCGGWLYALNALFVQVDEAGTRLLPAVPDVLPNTRFRDLRAEGGVLVSGSFEAGRLVSLTARAPRPMPWRFRIPSRYADLLGRKVETDSDGWVRVEISELPTGETDLLLRG